MEFRSKVALVTGAGSGIGRATAMKMAEEGATVGVLGHTLREIEKTAEDIRSRGGEAITLEADVADEADMRQSVKQIITETGQLDIVVVNAGINGVWAPIDDIKAAEWDHTIRVNLRGTYMTLNTTVPHLKRRGGAIIMVSSINGNRTFTTPGATAYAATKAAQVAMTQQLALELGRYGIRVNAVCPGAISTRIDDNTELRDRMEAAIPAEFPEGDIPLTGGVAGDVDDVASTILFLASDQSRHITGTPVYVDGGQSLLR